MKLGLIFTFILAAQITLAQNKVCFVNTSEIYAVLPDTKKAQEEIDRFKIEKSNEYDKLNKDLNEQYDKFVRDSARMTPAVKEAFRKNLQEKITEYSGKENEYKKLIAVKNEELNKMLSEKVTAATKKVALANGYNHILSVEAAIVYPKADEITDKVKVELGIK